LYELRNNPGMPPRKALTLDLLELLVEIESCGSISAAARKLGLSPSIATRRLAALERAMDARLFQRTTRKVRLTEGGKAALKWARRTLGDFADLSEEIDDLKGQPAGVIRIAMSDHAAAVFLPPFLKEFAPRYPKIRYQLETTDHLVNPMEHGYDVALHSGLIPDSSLIGIQIHAVQRLLCATPEYLARRGIPKSLADLAEHDCLAHSPSEPDNWYFQRDGKVSAQPVKPFLTADSYLALMESVRRGLGIARISRKPIQNDLRSGRLVQVLADYQCVHQNGELPAVWILYPDRRLLRRTRVFVDAFADYMKRVLS
jgi:molybdate transport repressor ModE-like protein